MPDDDETKEDDKSSSDSADTGDKQDQSEDKSSAGDTGSSSDIPEQVKSYIDSKFDALQKAIEGKPSGGKNPRRTDLAEEARRLVEQASERLEHDKEHAAAHAKLQEIAKKETEKQPIKQSRSQRFLFGPIDQ